MTAGDSRQRPKKTPVTAHSRSRKGKLSGSIIAIGSAAIVSVYALGRANTSAVSDQLNADTSTAAVSAAPAGNGQSTPTATYKDGTYTGTGDSRHGGMQVKVVIKDGKITSANVTSCSTRYPCSDVDPLVSSAVSKQSVPVRPCVRRHR